MAKIHTNPWLGLKAYSENETLYGRDEEIRSLSQYVMYDKETVLYGRSGIGKSSIINAGVIPVARRNDVTPVYIRLEHNATSDTYIEQIRKAMADVGVTIENVCPVHNADDELFWEFFHCNRFTDADGKVVKMLIIFDQFEEIFTLQRTERIKRNFFDQLADLLNDVKPSVLETGISVVAEKTPPVNKPKPTEENNSIFDINLDDLNIELPSDDKDYIDNNEYHIVFTLREDFLSDFEYYTAQIPPLKNHRFGLRPINEEQAADIILKPQPGLVSKQVAKLIMEKVSGRSDFELDGKPEIEVNSAILSLYMNRLFENKRDNAITAELVEEKGGEIIKDFYIESISPIPAATMESIEDELINEEGRRENKSYNILCANTGKKHIDHLVDCQLLRKFAYSGDMRVEFIHDILCPIILQRKTQRANEREKERLIRQAQLSRKRNQRIIGISAAIVAIFALFFCYFYFTTMHEYKACYAQFKRIYGWPVGIGNEMTDAERQTSPLYYQLSRKGVDADNFGGKVKKIVKIAIGRDNVITYTDVEVMSSNSCLPLMPRVTTPEVDGNNKADQQDAAAMEYYEKLKRIKTIHFVAGEGGKIDKEIVSDEQGKVLFVTSYFHLRTTRTNEAWLNFLNAEGRSMKVRDNGADRIKLAWDSIGNLTSMMYYNEQKACMPVTNGIYGNVMRICADETSVRYLVDEFGQPTSVLPYNTIATSLDRLETIYAYEKAIPDSILVMTIDQVLTTPASGPEGYTRCVRTVKGDSLFVGTEYVAWRTRERDEKGNVTLVTTEPINSKAAADFLATYSPYRTSNTYNEQGYQLSYEKTDHSGNPFVLATDSIYKKEWRYNGDDIVSEEWFATSGLVYSHKIVTKNNTTTETLDNKLTGKYSKKVETAINYSTTETAYYDRNGSPAIFKEKDDRFLYKELKYHKIKRITNSDGTEWTTYLYGTDSQEPEPYYSMEYKEDDCMFSFRTYDKDGSILKSMMYFLQDGQSIARAAMGIDGTPVRCPQWESSGASYYQLYQATDADNEFTSLRPVNEFGGLSVFEYEGSTLCLKYANLMGCSTTQDGVDYTIKNTYWERQLIKDEEAISHVSIPYLHLLSKHSRLYIEGLRDGDRIIKIDAKMLLWRFGDTEEILKRAWETMGKYGAEITVMRPEKTSFRTITFTIPPGQLATEEYHTVHLTYDELDHLKEFLPTKL